MVAGVMNSFAGAGTLVTFPALIVAGVPPIAANATSTVALWPGTLGSMWGYRSQVRGSGPWAVGFAIPSLLGGGLGAWFLLKTPAAAFASLVPWLVLGATALFMVQRPVMRWLGSHRSGGSGSYDGDPSKDIELTTQRPPAYILGYQFLVAVYGGYFGAGVGILMLAALGFMGLGNIHRMNGLKNWGGACLRGWCGAPWWPSDSSAACCYCSPGRLGPMDPASGYVALVVVIKRALFWAAAVVAVVALVDWLARTRRINPFGPIAQLLRKYIDPLMGPVERRIVRAGGQPSSAPWWTLVFVVVGGLVLVTALEFLGGLVAQLSYGLSSRAGLWVLLVSWTFSLLRLALIVRVVSTWFAISPYSKWIHWTYTLTEWMLAPLRRMLPLFGAIDVSPLIAFFLLSMIESLLVRG